MLQDEAAHPKQFCRSLTDYIVIAAPSISKSNLPATRRLHHGPLRDLCEQSLERCGSGKLPNLERRPVASSSRGFPPGPFQRRGRKDPERETLPDELPQPLRQLWQASSGIPS